MRRLRSFLPNDRGRQARRANAGGLAFGELFSVKCVGPCAHGKIAARPLPIGSGSRGSRVIGERTDQEAFE
jgi:hypothetical protein